MSLSQTVNYNNPANFNTSPKFIISSDLRLQKEIVAGNTVDQTFDDPTDFSFSDPTKAEVSAGTANQIDQTPADAIAVNNFDTKDLNYGDYSKIGVLGAGTVIANNEMVKTVSTDHVKYTGAAIIPANECCIRFRFIPDFTGAYGGTAYILSGGGTGQTFNLLLQSNSSVRFTIKNDAGAVAIDMATGALPMVTGVSMEFELNWNLSGQIGNLYVDGTRMVDETVFTGAITVPNSEFYFGSWISGSVGPINCSMTDLMIFGAVQNTGAARDTGYIIPPYQYAESIVTLPTPMAVDVSSCDGLAATLSGNVRFITNDKYWNGSAWVASDGSYSQANDVADVNTNYSDLDITSDPTIKVVFDDSATQGSIDLLTLTYSQFTTYYQDSPFVLANSGVLCDEVVSISEDVAKSATDDITYCINIDGSCYWYNTVDGVWELASSVLTSNSIDEMNANLSSLDLSVGKTIKITALPTSNDGTTTPILTSITINYNYAHDGTDPDKCVVYGTVKDTSGNPVVGAKIEVQVDATFYYSEVLISALDSTTTNEDGEWNMEVVENATYGGSYTFITEYNSGGKTKKRRDAGIVVPNTTSPTSLQSLI